MSDDILVEQRGRLGLITLNRPRAFNALTRPMCNEISKALRIFERNTQVRHVVMRSSENGRFFCAGGDIRVMQEDIREGIYDEAENFFRTEYRLNRQIATYSKPYISLIDGIVMGGGVGISGHGTYRVVTDNVVFAMPEVAIGFFPDVGASRLLAQLPGKFGAYLAITGERVGAEDLIYLGLATHHVKASALDDILQELIMGEDAKEVLRDARLKPKPAPLQKMADNISAYFHVLDLADIYKVLNDNKDDSFAAKCLSTLKARSPTSMAIALKQLQTGVEDVDLVLKKDFRIAYHMIRKHDFPEGVRALLVDKDQKPSWQPADYTQIDHDEIASYFEPLPPDIELDFAA